MCHHPHHHHYHQDSHEEEFLDLAGGKKEYVVTLSAIIEDAKMKGLKRVTYPTIVKDPKKENRNEVIIKNQNYERCQAYLHNNEGKK